MIRQMRMLGAFGIAATIALMAVACADPVAPNAPIPVAATITENFSGTLTIGGTDLFTFTVNQPGGLKVTLSSIVPSAAVQLSVGTPSTATGVCEPLNGLTAVAGPDAQISGTATVPGSFCVSVSDVGNLVEAVNFTVLVLHS